MVSLRHIFLNHVAQTSKLPLMLEVDRAEGMYIYDCNGKQYLDLNSGISVSSLGHCHPAVVKAVREQAGKYMHTMVYGEHIQSPQVQLASRLASVLSPGLDCVYLLNGGSEAVEAAIKLSRRHTRRYKIAACSRAYHGSTLGAESLRSDMGFTRYFAPGVPGISHVPFNDSQALQNLDTSYAAFILEPVQAEAGVIPPSPEYLKEVRRICSEKGILMILDEIQTGFGRTGNLFAHQKYKVVPDIMVIGKSMGGGMPLSAVVSSYKILSAFTHNPSLGHISTFGGHPVCCAAAHASLEVLLKTEYISQVEMKEKLFKELLRHPIIAEVRSSGLMMAVELSKRKYLKYAVNGIIERGALVDYFLFNDRSFRLAPPIVINREEIHKACNIILEALDKAVKRFEK